MLNRDNSDKGKPREIGGRPAEKKRDQLLRQTAEVAGKVTVPMISWEAGGWEKDNFDELVRGLTEQSIKSGQLVFMSQSRGQKEKFLSLLEERGIPAFELDLDEELVIVDVSECGTYAEERKKVKDKIEEKMRGREMIFVKKTGLTEDEEMNLKEDRVIITGGEEIIDLYLLWRVTLLYAELEEEDFCEGRIIDNVFWQKMEIFLTEYYQDEGEAGEAIALMKKGKFYLILPKIAPFVRDYYNALKGAKDLISHAA